MSDIFIGIDPGAKGAICALEPSVPIVEFIDFTDEIRAIVEWVNHLRINHEIKAAYIEDVHSLYGMSAKSNFTFGWNVGIPHTIFKALNISLDKVQPKAWQKAVGVTAKNSKEDKNAIKKDVASLCKEPYPDAVLHTPRGRLLDGRSDALMVAHYAYKLYEERKEN